MDKPFTVVTLRNNTEYTHTLLLSLPNRYEIVA